MFAVEAGGSVVGTLRWGRSSRGQRMVSAWFCAAVIFDVLDELLRPRLHNLQPLSNVWHLVSVVLLMESIAAFQFKERLRASIRYVIFAFAVLWLALHLTIEPIERYSTYSAPIHALVILGGAAWLLVQRVAHGRSASLADPAFLVAAGLCGYAVAAVFKTLVAQLWLSDHPGYVAVYFSACNVTTSLAELVMITALLIPSSVPGRPPK